MLDRLLPDIVPFLTQCSNLSDPLLRSTALWLLAVVSRQHSVNNNSTERGHLFPFCKCTVDIFSLSNSAH